jgi:hypothetical protein
MNEILDGKRILLCNLSKGIIGEDASSLLGAIILSSIQAAALQRASYGLEERIPFYVFVDECQSFITLSFVDILSEARKFGVALFLANQYVSQLDERIRSAIFGNVGSLLVFRVGAEDAEYLAKEFHPVFGQNDLINLPRYSMYLKLMIDGASSRAFSATTLPLNDFQISYALEIIDRSRQLYASHSSRVNFESASQNEPEPEPEPEPEHTLFK